MRVAGATAWTNWARTASARPAAVEHPADEGEVAAAVRRARAAGRRVRVAGAGHSFSALVPTEGTLLHLDRLDRVLAADRATGLVRVQAGITLRALGRALAEHGLALENQGDIDAQGLAGALATGTHGTGARFANLSANVAGLRLVDGRGEVVVLDEADELRAARISLGALGVVTEVTLRCVPAFALRRVDDPRPLGPVLAGLDGLVAAHDHLELFVFPHTGTALVRASDRLPAATRRSSRVRARLQEDGLENAALALACRAGRRVPGAVPALNRALAGASSRIERTDASHVLYANRRSVRFVEMEYAVPRAAGRELAERVLALVARRRLPVAFPIEVRFVAGDDADLSPAHGRDTCYVAVHQFEGMPHTAFFEAVEAVAVRLGGRPHWGKRHTQTAATLAPRYPRWAHFAAVRDRLDPERRFANAETERVLGP